MYKYSTPLFFLTMKRFFLPLAMTALCGLQQAIAAPDAESVEVELKLKASDAKFLEIVPKDMADANYFNFETRKTPSPAWFYMPIQYELRGECASKDGKPDYPLYVPELKVHVYCLFDMGKKTGGKSAGKTKFVMIDKEITYVDIPLPDRDSSKKEGLNKKVYAAVFVSPADAARLGDEAVSKSDKADKISKVDFGKNLAAIAVEFRVGDVEVSIGEFKKKNPKGIVVKKEYANTLNDGWWKLENTSVIDLKSIAETPFAPFYAAAFPPTANLYGTPDSTSSSGSADSTGDTYVPSAATEDAPAEEPADTGSKKKKSKKSRK